MIYDLQNKIKMSQFRSNKSTNINIPKSEPSEGSNQINNPQLSSYCYIKADKDHQDLEDLFGGKYLESQDIWRFDKKKEQLVYEFLDCSSSESEEENDEDDENYENNYSDLDETLVSETVKEVLQKKTPKKAPKPAAKKRDRLHRANSFNASDDSNDDCDSLDNNFRRHRISKDKTIQDSCRLKKEAK